MEIIGQFPLKYSGKDTDNHLVDGVALGRSLAGTSRTFNSIIRYYLHGSLRPQKRAIVRVQAGAPTEGSLIYMTYMVLVHGEMAMYPQVLLSLFELAVPRLFKAMVARCSGQHVQLDKALDAIAGMVDANRELVRNNQELARMINEAGIADKAMLRDAVTALTLANRGAMREMVAPIGPSVRQMEHLARGEPPTIIDEPTAEAIRIADDAEVGEQTRYVGRFVAVDTLTAAAKMKIQGLRSPLKCRITDPALKVPENIYTRALDSQSIVEVTGKPVLKDGEVATFFVSDAQPFTL